MDLLRVLVIVWGVEPQEVHVYRMLLPHTVQEHHCCDSPIHHHCYLRVLFYGDVNPGTTGRCSDLMQDKTSTWAYYLLD